jgi:hypothetical protein
MQNDRDILDLIKEMMEVKFTSLESKLDMIATNLNENHSRLETRVAKLEDEVHKLKDGPKNAVFDFFKALGNKVLWIFLGVAGSTLLWSLLDKDFWKRFIH